MDKEGAAYEFVKDVPDLRDLYRPEAKDSHKNLLLGPYRKAQEAYVESFLDVFDANTSKVIIITRDPADCIYLGFMP